MSKERVRLTVRVHRDVAEKLKRLSAATGLTTNALVTGALHYTFAGRSVESHLKSIEKPIGSHFLQGPLLAAKTADEMIRQNPKLTLDRVRRILQKRGFRTTRGGNFSMSGFSRLLQRYRAEQRRVSSSA